MINIIVFPDGRIGPVYKYEYDAEQYIKIYPEAKIIKKDVG